MRWTLWSMVLGMSLALTNAACPTDWKNVKGKCFLFVNTTVEYSAAVTACTNAGGKLFEPMNRPSNAFLVRVASQQWNMDDPKYWIGISDQTNEGRFAYESSGALIKFDNWQYPDQPDNDNADCAAVINNNAEWADENCTNSTYNYICEDLQEVTFWSACQTGWNLINEKCYKFIDETVKFDAASDMCRALGAKIFEPTYELVEEMVTNYYNNENIWIGVTDRGSEGSFAYASTGAPVSYTNWGPKTQSNNKGNEDCVMLNGTQWEDMDCNCGDVAKTVCVERTVESCPEELGWEVVHGRCFYFSVNESTYEDAENDCIDKGGRLFEPKNAEANTLIYTYNVIVPFWIGVKDIDEDENYVYASDGASLAFESWADNQPDNENHYCSQVIDHQANWGDAHCDAPREYVCERPYDFNLFWDQIPLVPEQKEIVDYIFDTFFEKADCADEEEEEEDEEPVEPPSEEGQRHYMTFGGFGDDGKSTESVYLVDVDAQRTCLHSTLPVAIKESHVFEYNDTLLLCTTFTAEDSKNLQCFIWEPLTGWENFTTPDSNGIFSFMSAVRMPGVGIWFITIMGSPTGSNTLLLDENTGNWTSGLMWSIHRNRACAVLINNNTVANIGGQPKPGNPTIGTTIDTYNFETNTESLAVATMAFNRKQHGCALIPNGPSGNPTVAIIGDNSSPYPFVMELWDTVTNNITQVPHPPGFETSRFFRPGMTTFDDDSILLAAAQVYDDDGNYLLDEAWQYKVGEGWINLGQAIPPKDGQEQIGLYMLDNPTLPAYTSLNRCAF